MDEREENTEDSIPPLVKQRAMPRKTEDERETAGFVKHDK